MTKSDTFGTGGMKSINNDKVKSPMLSTKYGKFMKKGSYESNLVAKRKLDNTSKMRRSLEKSASSEFEDNNLIK